MARHPPPPTKFAVPMPVQPKRAGEGAGRAGHAPPPTRFGPQSMAQPKAVTPPAGGRAAPSPPSPPPTRFAAPAMAPAVQRMHSLSDGGITDRFFRPQPNTYYSGDLDIDVSTTKQGDKDIDIRLTDTMSGHSAHLHGGVEGKDAYIGTVEGGRYPGGRGVSYLLIFEFALAARKQGATRVSLGTAVNEASLNASNYTPQTHPGEWAAVTVYRNLGWDVRSKETVSESFVGIDDLARQARAKATAKGWL